MSKKRKFIFLSEKFYKDYPPENYPEMERKQNRPYVQVFVEIDGVQYAIPLRSDIHHPHVLWTDKANHCGVDFSKAVVISKEEYIDSSREPYLRQNEFNALRGKEYKIKIKMEKYIAQYKAAKADMSKDHCKKLVKFSTLQYFENEIGLNDDSRRTEKREAAQKLFGVLSDFREKDIDLDKEHEERILKNN